MKLWRKHPILFGVVALWTVGHVTLWIWGVKERARWNRYVPLEDPGDAFWPFPMETHGIYFVEAYNKHLVGKGGYSPARYDAIPIRVYWWGPESYDIREFLVFVLGVWTWAIARVLSLAHLERKGIRPGTPRFLTQEHFRKWGGMYSGVGLFGLAGRVCPFGTMSSTVALLALGLCQMVGLALFVSGGFRLFSGRKENPKWRGRAISAATVALVAYLGLYYCLLVRPRMDGWRINHHEFHPEVGPEYAVESAFVMRVLNGANAMDRVFRPNEWDPVRLSKQFGVTPCKRCFER